MSEAVPWEVKRNKRQHIVPEPNNRAIVDSLLIFLPALGTATAAGTGDIVATDEFVSFLRWMEGDGGCRSTVPVIDGFATEKSVVEERRGFWLNDFLGSEASIILFRYQPPIRHFPFLAACLSRVPM